MIGNKEPYKSYLIEKGKKCMDKEESKLFLEKVKNILYDFDVHHISCDLDIFGGITMKEIIYLARQLIYDQNFNEDDYELIFADWDTDEG